MSELSGRVALVTGGGRGIGRGISELLAANGATIAVNYRNDADAAADTVAGIVAAGGEARAYGASVADADACASMVESIVADFGGIDILVCNAGIASKGRAVADTDPAEMERVVATHAFGPHHLSRLVLPSMRARSAERGRGDVEVGGLQRGRRVGRVGRAAQRPVPQRRHPAGRTVRRVAIDADLVVAGAGRARHAAAS